MSDDKQFDKQEKAPTAEDCARYEATVDRPSDEQTPRTDAFFNLRKEDDGYSWRVHDMEACHRFASQLERDLAYEREWRAKLQDVRDDLLRTIERLNADLSARRDITDEAIIAAFSNGGGVDEIPTHQPHAPLLTNTQIVWVVRRFIAGLCSIPFTRNDVLEEAANVCEQMRPSSTSPDLNVQCQTLDNAARLIRALKS